MQKILTLLILISEWLCGRLCKPLAALCAFVAALTAYVLPRMPRRGVQVRGVLTALLLVMLTSTSWIGANAQVLTEGFADADSTTLAGTKASGNTYTVVFGTAAATISGNQLHYGNGQITYKSSAVTTGNNYTISFDITQLSVAAWSGGVIGRLQANGNGIAVVYHNNNGAITCYKITNSGATQTELGRSTLSSSGFGTHTISVAFIGQTIQIYIDGTYSKEFFDATYTSGFAGFYGNAGTATTAQGYEIDNYKVYNNNSVQNSILFTDPLCYCSPFNTFSDGTGTPGTNNVLPGSTYVESNTCGWYMKFAFTGTSLRVVADTTKLIAASVASGSYPTVEYSVDSSYFTNAQFNGTTANNLVVNRTGLAAGTHTFFLMFKTTDRTIDRWSTPVNTVKFQSITIDSSATLVSAVGTDVEVRPKTIIGYSDSTGEGVGTSDAFPSHVYQMSFALNAEVGFVCYASQGYTIGGLGNVPALSAAYNLYWAGASRLFGGLLSPSPDYIYCGHGTNSAGGVTPNVVNTMLTNFRTVAPNAKILLCVPFGGYARTNITASTRDSNTVLVDLGTAAQQNLAAGAAAGLYSDDGLHPSLAGYNKLSPMLTRAIQQQISFAQTVRRRVQGAEGMVSLPTLTLTIIYCCLLLKALPELRRAFSKRK